MNNAAKTLIKLYQEEAAFNASIANSIRLDTRQSHKSKATRHSRYASEDYEYARYLMGLIEADYNFG